MKIHREVDIKPHAFLTIAIYGEEWSASHSNHVTPQGKGPGDYWTGGWVSPRAGQDVGENKNSCLCQKLNADHSVHNQSLY
jgi:hypothetical protein